jgi:hypothetical protein
MARHVWIFAVGASYIGTISDDSSRLAQYSAASNISSEEVHLLWNTVVIFLKNILSKLTNAIGYEKCQFESLREFIFLYRVIKVIGN